VDYFDRAFLAGLHLAQSRLWQRELAAVLMNLVKRFINFVWLNREDRCKDSSDSFDWKRGQATVFAHAGYAVVTARCDQDKSSSAASDRDDAARLHDFA